MTFAGLYYFMMVLSLQGIFWFGYSIYTERFIRFKRGEFIASVGILVLASFVPVINILTACIGVYFAWSCIVDMLVAAGKCSETIARCEDLWGKIKNWLNEDVFTKSYKKD